MNLSPFSDVPFKDEDAFQGFQLAHGLAHDRIAAVMYAASKFYEVYPLYDNPKQDRDWKLTHQQEHQSIFNLLGMTGLPDLATVDFDDEGDFFDWMLVHQQIHSRINAALNIF